MTSTSYAFARIYLRRTMHIFLLLVSLLPLTMRSLTTPSIYPHLFSTKTTTLYPPLHVQFHVVSALNSRPTSRLSISIIRYDSPLTQAQRLV